MAQGKTYVICLFDPKEWGGGVRGRRETAVDDSRKETADRVAKCQTDCVGRTCLSMLLVTRTAAAASGAFVLLRFSCPSFRFWSYSVYVLALLCFVCHVSGGSTTPLLFYFSFDLSLSFFSLPLHCLLFLLHYSVVSLCCRFGDHRACIPRRKNRHGGWVCWMSTGRQNGLM